MRLASLAGTLVILLSGAALAAQGDSLVVTGNGVNLRVEPRSNAKVLLQLYRNDPAVELERQGSWVEVRLPDRDATGWIHASLVTTAGNAAPPAAATAEPAPPPAPPPVATVEPPPPPVATASPGRATGPAPAAASPPPEQAAGANGRAPGPKPGGPQVAALEGAAGTDALARFRDSVTYLNNRAVAAAGVELFTGVKPAGAGVVQVTATDAWTSVPADGQQSFMNTLFDRWLAASGAGQPLSVQVVDRSGRVLREKSGP